MDTGYLGARVRVADYLRARTEQMKGGNIGDEIGTVATTVDDELLWTTLLHSDLRTLLDGGHKRTIDRATPLTDELRAAAARLADYVSKTRDMQEGVAVPPHWGVVDVGYPHPWLAVDRGEEVESLGTLIDLDDAELDLIGLFSPQTAASLSNLLDGLADWLDMASMVDLVEMRWLAEAAALAQALNRKQEWSTHPGGVRMTAPLEDQTTIPGNPFPPGDPRGWAEYQGCITDLCAVQRQHTPHCPQPQHGGVAE